MEKNLPKIGELWLYKEEDYELLVVILELIAPKKYDIKNTGGIRFLGYNVHRLLIQEYWFGILTDKWKKLSD